jgi:hypothetical protein
MVMASEFDQAAKESYSPDLHQRFADADARLAEACLEKMH